MHNRQIELLEQMNERLRIVIEKLELLVPQPTHMNGSHKSPSLPKTYDYDDQPLTTSECHTSPNHPLANHDWDR